jgi:CheY-like chemotaxis protein
MPGAVLCVDNDRDLVQIIAKALESEGYRVLRAYDGEQAVETAASERPDLVLLDLILPRRDGFAVLEAIRGQDGSGRATPVVLLTGCTPGPAYRQRAAELGAADLLTKPLPLAKLLSVVAGHIAKGEGPRDRARSGLSGSLASLPLPALLHHLHGLRAVGVLHLANGKRRKWIELRDGRPVAVRSNLVNECLGNFLVRTGRISQSALDESRRRMVAGKLQGEILVAMDVLREEEIPEVLRAQAQEKLLEAFSWKSGSFRFDIGGRLQRANELPLDRSPANLILQGVRERLPVERVDAWLRANAGSGVVRAESPFYRFQEIDLEPAHEDLLGTLHSSRPLAGFRDADEDLRRSLFGLVATGMLDVLGGQTSAPPPPASPPARPARADDEALRAELTALAERIRDQDPFEVLGISPSSGDDELREAYERLSELAHSDRVAGAGAAVRRLAEEIQARVGEAFETLNDPSRRADSLQRRRREERDEAARAEARAALDAELQCQYGEAALRQRDYPGALECFRRAIDLYGEAGEYHTHYGWALHLCHPRDKTKLAEAIRHVRHGLKLARESEKSYLFMGRLLKAADRVDAAERMFTRAVQIQPDCFEAIRELRLINMRREKGKGLVRRLFRR